jgi:bifunctional ADP-heptose synthase (sugar kinase/adenylyltransferase)
LTTAQTTDLAAILVTISPPNLSLRSSDDNVVGIINRGSKLYDVEGAKGEYIMYILPFHRYVRNLPDVTGQ